MRIVESRGHGPPDSAADDSTPRITPVGGQSAGAVPARNKLRGHAGVTGLDGSSATSRTKYRRCCERPLRRRIQSERRHEPATESLHRIVRDVPPQPEQVPRLLQERETKLLERILVRRLRVSEFAHARALAPLLVRRARRLLRGGRSHRPRADARSLSRRAGEWSVRKTKPPFRYVAFGVSTSAGKSQ